MKRDHRLLITGLAFSMMVGALPALSQETKAAAPGGQPAKTPPSAVTPAQPTSDPAATPRKELSPAEKCAEINRLATATLDTLKAKSPEAHKLYNRAYGYAVFDNFKLSFLLSGSGGKGVAVAKATGQRTYMNMGGAGVGLGAGAHKHQIVFLFETEDRFNQFINEGWTANVSANAVAGKAGANAEATFEDGMAYYQLTEAGLMLQADIGGTRYWRDEELNKLQEATD